MLFPSLSTKKKFVAALILGFQIFMPLAMPVHVAQAADTFANTGAVGGTPSSTGNVPTLRDWVTAPLESAQAVVSKAASATVGGVADATLGNALKFVGWIFFEVAGKFLQMMAYILDMSIDKTVDSSMYKGLSAINVGWTAIRDITNMFFIFVLLYISILTILGMAGSSTKSWVAHLIIAALLINFSLFATQVVVDAGNMLTVGFWNNIKTTNGDGSTTGGFAPIILEGLKMQTVFNGGEGSNVDKAKIYFGGAIFMFIAGYVVLAGAIMMIVRTVTLIILMIVSPFAFLGFALPKGGGFADTWLKKLIGATFVAPAFVMMLYINMIIVRSMDIKSLGGAGGSQFSAALKGDVSNFAIIYNFLVMIILMLSSLYVAKKVSEDIGGSAGGWAKKTLGHGGAAAIATSAYGLRRSVGASAERIKNSERIQKAAQQTGIRGAMARATIRTSNVAAKSSFDARNAPGMKALGGFSGVNFGAAGGAGGYRGYRKSGDESVVKRAEELFPNNPSAQQKYIQNATRTDRGMTDTFVPKAVSGKLEETRKAVVNTVLPDGTAKKLNEFVDGVNQSRLDTKPKPNALDDAKVLSKKKFALDRDVAKKEAKDTLEAKKKEQEALEQKITGGSITPEAAAKEGEVIATAVKEAMMKLTTSERAELASTQKDNIHFINNLDKSDYSMIHKAEMEGKSNGTLKDITEKAMKSDNEKLQNYILNPENQNRLTMVDQDKIRGDASLMKKYQERVSQVEAQNKRLKEEERIQKGRIEDADKAREEALKEKGERDLLGSIGNV